MLKTQHRHLLGHYVIGIMVGAALGLIGYFMFTTFQNHSEVSDNNSLVVQDSDTRVESVAQTQDLNTKNFPKKYELVEGDPQTVWNHLEENDQVHVGRIVDLINTANAWIAQEGLGVLNEIHTSLTDKEARAAFFSGVIFTAAEGIGYQDLFYLAQDTLTDNNLRREFMWRVARMWAPVHPIAAFAAATQIENHHDRAEVMKSVVEIWAKTDTELLKEWLHAMPPHVISHAEWMVIVAIAKDAPADALAYLPRFVRTPYEKELMKEIASSWASSDVEGALEWVLNYDFTTDRLRNRTLGTILYEIAESDVERALQIALSEPVDDWSRGPEGYLLVQIAAKDIDRAIELADRTRDGMTRRFAYEAIAVNLARAYKFDRAVELGENLMDEEGKRSFFDHLLPDWALKDPVDLFDKLTSFQSEILQSRAAMHLVDTESYRHNVLTEEQLDLAKAYMSIEDYGEMIERRVFMKQIDMESEFIETESIYPLEPDVGEYLDSLFQLRSSF